MSLFSLENVLGKDPEFLQSDGTHNVYDNTVSEFSRTWVERQSAHWRKSTVPNCLGSNGVLAVKDCREKFADVQTMVVLTIVT